MLAQKIAKFAYFMAPLIFVISVTYGLILKLVDSQIILSGQTAIFIVGKI